MSIRALWIISLTNTGNGKVVFSKTFTTVERRASQVLGDTYKPFPDVYKLVSRGVLCQLSMEKSEAEKFSTTRDKCTMVLTPVLQLDLGDESLWPVVVTEHYGCVICCLPLVEVATVKRETTWTLTIPAITTALSVLSNIQNFLGPLPAGVNHFHESLLQLNLYLGSSMPFGRPVEVHPSVVKTMLLDKEAMVDQMQKQPPQRPAYIKNRQTGMLAITEYIRAVQFNQTTGQDSIEVYGIVAWKGVLESPTTEVTALLLQEDKASRCCSLSFVSTHPCVNQVEASSSMLLAKKLRFTPVLEAFHLCYYSVQTKGSFPIYGSYKLRCEPTHIDLLLQLKLDVHMKNTFNMCEVKLPLSHSGKVVKVDLKPSWGTASISADGEIVSWVIGQNFPSKSLEVSLTGIVYFAEPIERFEEVFRCAHANIQFHVEDYTFSGLRVDLNSIQFSPPTRFKVSSARNCMAVDYQIWNTCTDPPILPTWTG